MKTQLQEFENEEFGKIRVVEIDGQPWWVLTDICTALGLTTPSRVAERLDEDGVSLTHIIDSVGRKQRTTIVNESGLYAVILRSDKPKAKDFRRWLTSEVIPSICRHGVYITDETLRRIREDDTFIDELIERLATEKAKKNALLDYVSELAPKARYYDIILQCPNAVQTSIIAKDYAMSCVTFNKMLHKLGVQFKVNKTWLLYKTYANNGYTVSRTYHIDGKIASIHTLWTPKGRFFLYDFLKWHGILPEAEKMAEH